MDWSYSFNEADPSIMVAIAQRGTRYIAQVVDGSVKVQTRGSDLDEVLSEVRRLAAFGGDRQRLAAAIEEVRAKLGGEPQVTASEPLLPAGRAPLPLS